MSFLLDFVLFSDCHEIVFDYVDALFDVCDYFAGVGVFGDVLFFFIVSVRSGFLCWGVYVCLGAVLGVGVGLLAAVGVCVVVSEGVEFVGFE